MALRKLSPSRASISPGEKCARSSSVSALAISDGSLSFAPFGAASLIEAAVGGGQGGCKQAKHAVTTACPSTGSATLFPSDAANAARDCLPSLATGREGSALTPTPLQQTLTPAARTVAPRLLQAT